MPGTISGGRAAAVTNVAKYGSEFYAQIGAIGGSKRVAKGFALNRDLASIAGTLGGSISRKGRHKLTKKERRQIRKAYEELLKVHLNASRERKATARLAATL